MTRIPSFLMLALGLWIVIRRKVPPWLQNAEAYSIMPEEARVLGMVLTIPLPVALALSVSLYLIFGEGIPVLGTYIEPALTLIALFLFFLLQRPFRLPIGLDRKGRKKVKSPDKGELAASFVARQVVYYAVLTSFGLIAPFFGPMTVQRAGQGLDYIRETGDGASFAGLLRITRVVAIVLTVFYGIVLAYGAGRMLGVLPPLGEVIGLVPGA
mgnify:CR=1 FL=1